MAKRTSNSSVNSSIREGTKTQESGFTQLLELQKISNEHLGSIADAISADSRKLSALIAVDALAALEQKRIDKTIAEENDSLNEIEDSQKELVRLSKTNNERSARDAAAIGSIAQSMKTFKTLGEKLSSMKQGLGDKFGKGNIGRTALSALNVGGLLNKKIAQGDFIKQQKELGSTKTDKELKTDFTKAQKASKEIDKNEAAIVKHKKITGGSAGALTDEQIMGNEKGKALLEKRGKLSGEYAKHDLRSNVDELKPIPIKMEVAPLPAPETAKNDIIENRKTTVSEEDKNESSRIQEQQLFLLKQIVSNTTPHEAGSKVKLTPGGGESTGGGGILGMLGVGLGKLGEGAGKGLGAILRGIGGGLLSLAPGLIALTPAIPVILTLAVAAVALGKALELAAPAIEAFAPVLMKVAEVIGGVFIEAIKAIPEILKSIGDVIVNIVTSISDAITGIMDSIVTSIERLGAVDGSNLLSVGAGLLAVGAGMAAFGAGGAVAGVANLVTGFLGAVSGQKSPIEQLEQIASYGPGLAQAGIGMEKLSQGLSSFGSNAGSKVSNMSGQVGAMKEQGSGGSNIVSAPTVNNNTKNTSIAKITTPVRTQESSVDRYFGGRAVY